MRIFRTTTFSAEYPAKDSPASVTEEVKKVGIGKRKVRKRGLGNRNWFGVEN